MKKILLATLFLVNIEAQELADYLKECSPMEDMCCVDMKELSSQAMLSFRQQKFAQAIEKFKRVMSMAEKEKLEPSNFYNNLGLAYNNSKEYDNALKYFRKNVEYELKKGAKRNKVLLSIVYGNMGLAYMGKREFSKAIEVAQKSLDIVYKLKDNSKIAERENKIGIVYRANREYDKAIEHYQKSIDIKMKEIPKDYPMILAIYSDIVGSYQNKKKYTKALKVLDKVLEIKKKVFEKNHPEIIKHYISLGYLNLQKKDYDKAIENYEKASEMGIDKLDHEIVLNFYTGMAQTWLEKKEFDKSLNLYQKAKDKSVEMLGENHYITAMSYVSMGNCYFLQKKYKEAKQVSLKALDIYKKTVPKNHPSVQALFKNLKLIDEHFITIYHHETLEGKYAEQRKKAEAFVKDFIQHYNQNDDSFLLEAFVHLKKLCYMEEIKPSSVKKMFVKMRKEWGEMKSHKYMGAILTRAMVKTEVSPDKFERQVFHKLVYSTKFERGTIVAMQFYFMFRPDGTMFFQRMRGTDTSIIYDIQ